MKYYRPLQPQNIDQTVAAITYVYRNHVVIVYLFISYPLLLKRLMKLFVIILNYKVFGH